MLHSIFSPGTTRAGASSAASATRCPSVRERGGGRERGATRLSPRSREHKLAAAAAAAAVVAPHSTKSGLGRNAIRGRDDGTGPRSLGTLLGCSATPNKVRDLIDLRQLLEE